MQGVAVIGLGCSGLPLLKESGKHGRTLGFDIVPETVISCRGGNDPSREISDAAMALPVHAEYTGDPRKALPGYGLKLSAWASLPRTDAIVPAVAQTKYQQIAIEEIARKVVNEDCLIDVNAGFDAAALEGAGLAVWRL
jgi:hypothetical protein